MASYQVVKNLYPDVNDPKRIQCLQNETEFTCYYIINMANSKTGALQGISKLDINYFKRDPQSFEYLKQAIRISLNIASGDNAPEYFIILKRQKSYLIACLMLQFINQMRLDLLENINKGTRSDAGMDLNFIAKMLLFDNIKDAYSFVEACGFQKIQGNTVWAIGRYPIEQEEQKQQFIKWRQEGSFQFMNAILGSQSRGKIMQTPLINSIASNKLLKIYKPAISTQNQLVQQNEIPAQKEAINNKNLQPDQLKLVIPGQDNKKDAVENEKQIQIQKQKEDDAQMKKDQEDAAAKELALKKAQEQQDAEKVRLKLIAEEKAKKEREAVDRFRKLAVNCISQLNQQVKASLLSFFNENKSLLVKRLHPCSSISDMQEINEEEYLDLILQKVPSVTLQKQISENYRESQFQSKLASISSRHNKEPFSISKLVQDLLGTDKETVFKAKLFYHKANLDGTSSSADNLQAIIELFDSKSFKAGEKIKYKFTQQEFPNNEQDRGAQIMQSMIGTNLLIVFSSLKSLIGDIQKLILALDQCPDFSRFSLLWIVNRDLDKNFSSEEVQNIQEDKEINKNLGRFKRSEILSAIEICLIYSSQIKIHQPSSKRLQTISSSQRKLSQDVIKNIALAFIKPSLESSIKVCKTYSISKSSIKMKKLKALIIECAGTEITNLLLNDKSDVLKHIKTLASVKNVRNLGILNKEEPHEVEILNFLISLTQALLKNVSDKIKDSIQQICQQFAYSEYNIKTAQELKREHEKIDKILKFKRFSGIKSNLLDERIENIGEQVKTLLIGFYESPKILDHVIKRLAGIKIYDNTITREPHISNYYGVTYYSILMTPIFESFSEQPFVFQDPDVSFHQAISQLNLSSLIQPHKLKEKEVKKSKYTVQSIPLIVSTPLQNDIKLLKKRKNPIQFLEEEMKDQFDPLLISNKRIEVETKRCLDIIETVGRQDTHMQELLWQNEEQEKFKEDEVKVQPPKPKRVRYDRDLSDHKKELEEMEKLLQQGRGSTKRRVV